MITVRPATMDDAEAIARQTADTQRLHHESVPDLFRRPSANLFPPRKLARLLQDADAIVAVAESEGTGVGHIFAALIIRAASEFQEPAAHLHIHQIAVDEGARRQGAGRALVRFIEERARERGLSEVQVDHWAFNGRARGFFEACGYAPMKITMRRAVSDGGPDAGQATRRV